MQNLQNPSYPVGAAGNALRTLLLLHEHGELRVSDVAEHLEVARSTAHRVLAMLVFHGFAEQDDRHRYRPGPSLQKLRGVPSHPPDLVITARPHLQRLAESTGETTHLMVLEGNGCRFLDGVEGPQMLRVTHRTGLLLPAHATSGGKALLAELGTDRFNALYPKGLPAGGTGRAAEFGQLAGQLAAARRAGYAYNLQESEPGVNAVGACVHERTGRAVAAIAVAAPSSRCPRSRLTAIAQELVATARRISASL